MTKFVELQQTHQRLLDRMDEPPDETAFVREVQNYIAHVCDEAVDVPDPHDRDQLRANLRYWASYVYDHTGTYPKTTLRPAQLSLSEFESATSSGTATSSFRFTIIGMSVAFMLLLVLIGLILLNRQGELAIMDAQNRAIQATNEAVNVLFQATHAAATQMALPTSSPRLINTAGPATPEAAVPAEELLTIDYQVLTQGPSPFDPMVWVMELKLVGTGGNGHYIYWLNGQQLDGDEVIVQGARCEPQTITLGVTSHDQAVKQAVTLGSPLRDCLTGPR